VTVRELLPIGTSSTLSTVVSRRWTTGASPFSSLFFLRNLAVDPAGTGLAFRMARQRGRPPAKIVLVVSVRAGTKFGPAGQAARHCKSIVLNC